MQRPEPIDPRSLTARGWHVFWTIYVPIAVDGHAVADVARQLGLHESTTRSRLRAIERALAKIRAGNLKTCRYCKDPIAADARSDAKVCGDTCRLRKHRKRHRTWKTKPQLELEREMARWRREYQKLKWLPRFPPDA